MSDSARPHRRQPTRLPRPWDSSGKNTGGGCHFLLQRMKVKSESEVAQLCPTLSDPMDCSLPGSSIHGIFQAWGLEWGAIAFSDSEVIVPAKIVNTACTYWFSDIRHQNIQVVVLISNSVQLLYIQQWKFFFFFSWNLVLINRIKSKNFMSFSRCIKRKLVPSTSNLQFLDPWV